MTATTFEVNQFRTNLLKAIPKISNLTKKVDQRVSLVVVY